MNKFKMVAGRMRIFQGGLLVWDADDVKFRPHWLGPEDAARFLGDMARRLKEGGRQRRRSK